MAVQAMMCPKCGKETEIFSQDDLASGNVVQGPAVIEHAFGACAIPEGKKITFDEYRNGIIESG